MKGGIDHCAGSIFICNDGTASASKKDCQKYIGLYKGAGSTDDDTSKPSPKRRKPATGDRRIAMMLRSQRSACAAARSARTDRQRYRRISRQI
jgi:hypothetical protein